MRVAFISVALGVLASWSASGQSAMAVKNKEEIFNTPLDAIQAKLKRVQFTEDDLNSYMWSFSHDTMGQDVKIRRNIGESETGPYWSRRSVWADATMAARMKEFGAGRYAHEAILLPTTQDRWLASQMPEADYPDKSEHLAILAAVYRHFFGYRAQGMGREAHAENTRLRVKDVYFLGLGPHVIDAPASLLAALQADPGIQRDGIRIQPLRNVLEVTDEAIRDRATGAYGIAFRVDEIGEVRDGELHVAATFTEREGFWFTRELTLRQGKDGWSVTGDADYATR
jgi:hypothetical protein